MFEESDDQKALFDAIITGNSALVGNNLNYTAWGAAYACRDKSIVKILSENIGFLDPNSKRDVTFATMRMSVTNPYFFSRQFVQLNAGGTLSDLNFRGFDKIKVADEIAYHYACLAVSMINGGYVCFASHIGSLQQAGETADAIDAAMRLTASINAMRQMNFINHTET